MKQLLTRIEGLEKSVKSVLDRLSSLKEENEILSQENNRLHEELNQLRKSSERLGKEDSGNDRHNRYVEKSDINVGHIKKELDQCIEELEACLREM